MYFCFLLSPLQKYAVWHLGFLFVAKEQVCALMIHACIYGALEYKSQTLFSIIIEVSARYRKDIDDNELYIFFILLLRYWYRIQF